MKKSIVLVVLVLVLALIFFVFYGRDESSQENPSSPEEFTGENLKVTEVNLDAMAYDGPAIIKARDESSSEVTIAIPSMGLPLCEAFENIASVSVVELNDMISVKGYLDNEGQIVPCESRSHYLRVSETLSDSDLGIKFSYKKGPDGYILIENESGETEAFVGGYIIFDREEYEAFSQSTDAREGPPAINISVYENPEKMSAFNWPEANPSISNVELAIGETEETVLAGANANKYIVDGLYPIETYVVAQGENIYLITGAYLEMESNIYRGFQDILGSLEFIMTENEMGSETEEEKG